VSFIFVIGIGTLVLVPLFSHFLRLNGLGQGYSTTFSEDPFTQMSYLTNVLMDFVIYRQTITSQPKLFTPLFLAD
jgi:hypothetical protein